MDFSGLASSLRCCECGTPIVYNPYNLCKPCLTSKVDITNIIPKEVNISHCFTCSRFLNPPSHWVSGNNPDQLLQVCLKLIKGLNKFNIVNAKFLYTEPHSKRLKVQVVVNQNIHEIANTSCDSLVIEQSAIIEYVMVSHICQNCTRDAAKDYWNALVQVRQKTNVKTTLMYMEQIILKANAHEDILNLKKVRGGIDFFYGCKSHAAQLVNFLSTKLPIRSQESKKLKSQDEQNNTYNYKFTYLVEIPPICKNDIVILPKSFAQKIGNMSQICIVLRITEMIHLIDPATARVKCLEAAVYFHHPFFPIATFKNFTQFMIMDIEERQIEVNKKGDNPVAKNYKPADAYVTSMNNMNEQIHVRTHLGNVLNYGDVAVGVDLRTLNCNNEIFDKMNEDKIPDIILVKKYYSRSLRCRKRHFRLNKIVKQGGSTTTDDNDDDRNEFLENLEEDDELRQNVNMYYKARDTNAMLSETEDEDLPTIPITELIGSLNLNDTDAPTTTDIDME